MKPASSPCIPIVPSARPLARPLRPFPHPTHSSLNARRQFTMSITPASTLTCFRMPCHHPPVIQPLRKFPAPRGDKRRFRRSLRTPGEFGKKKVLRLHGTSRVACVLLDSSRARCSCRAACLLPPLHRALPRVPRACIRLRATWHGHAADCAHAVQCAQMCCCNALSRVASISFVFALMLDELLLLDILLKLEGWCNAICWCVALHPTHAHAHCM